MKGIIRVLRILNITIFVSGIVLYLLFASAHPLLHNHPTDSHHHHNCPACSFLAAASFSIVPEAVTIPPVFLQITCHPFFEYQQPCQKLFPKNHLIRGPPLVSV